VGAESDHLIFDYLSKVGDLAQSRLPVESRVRLVTRLRSDIDRARGRAGSDSPAAVRRILGKLGSPDDVVDAAAGAGSAAATEAGVPGVPGVPEQRTAKAEEWWRLEDKQGPQQPQGLQWPRESLEPMVPGQELAGLPGMTGGVTVPMGPVAEDEDEDGHEEEDEEEDETEAGEEEAAEKASLWRRLRRRRAPEAWDEDEVEDDEPEAPVRRARVRGRVAPVETFAALLLVAGAVPVRGTWPALVVGWLIAYYSPRLTRAQAKFAALTVPGLVAGSALVWLWGRMDGRWGERIAKGQLDTAIAGAFPVVVRIAAVASAAFLVWRSRRA